MTFWLIAVLLTGTTSTALNGLHHDLNGPPSRFAQKTDTTSFVKIASDDEPGQPMLIRGVVFDNDGITPLAGVLVHVYHTDAEGNYGPKGAPQGTIRLKGDMITGPDGEYSYQTIIPASYPGSRAPAHVHYKVHRTRDSAEEWFALEFANDPYISDKKKASEKAKGKFSSVILLEERDGMHHGEFNLRLKR